MVICRRFIIAPGSQLCVDCRWTGLAGHSLISNRKWGGEGARNVREGRLRGNHKWEKFTLRRNHWTGDVFKDIRLKCQWSPYVRWFVHKRDVVTPEKRTWARGQSWRETLHIKVSVAVLCFTKFFNLGKIYIYISCISYSDHGGVGCYDMPLFWALRVCYVEVLWRKVKAGWSNWRKMCRFHLGE